jgi:short-subunit dehydrogenase
MPKIRDCVVVIIGASSGIGKATAQAFAKKGATVVVAARRVELLQRTATECEQLGAQAVLAVPTDMTDLQAVQKLADLTLATFGRIDVWINNQGVGLFTSFEEAPLEDYRRAIEVDLFGTIYGSRVVLPIFRKQGAGILINQGSMDSKLSAPYLSAYTIAKHGVRALGMGLRQELALSGSKKIHVCTVMPATIDTPFFQHAANYTGRTAKALPPVYPPERVARTIVNLVRWPRREVFVGNAARLFWWQFLLAPGLTERMMAVLVDKLHLYQDKPAPPTSGSLFEPMTEGTGITGGWRTVSGRNSADVENKGSSLVSSVAVGLISLLVALVLWSRAKR